MAAPLETCTKVEARSIVRFCFLSSEGVKSVEIHRQIKIQKEVKCSMKTCLLEVSYSQKI